MSQRSTLNQRKKHKMSGTKGTWMAIEQRTWTYLGFPYHPLFWTQWSSEAMNLRAGKEGDDGMNGGRERNKTESKNSQVKWDKHDRTQTNTKKMHLVYIPSFLCVCFTVHKSMLNVIWKKTGNCKTFGKTTDSFRNPEACKAVSAVSR